MGGREALRGAGMLGACSRNWQFLSGVDGSETSQNNKLPAGLALLTVPRAVLGKHL